ncbi:RluA family pseudouridine synthase [Xanthobacter dioxanivorans]|uniref:RluA family pseudouridine synthase n=1 Tax=Xanthobacter dioxanivorans TaxID=2528964 RepID=A0A974PKK3_9HYPH|nr:RluA family pseudouridine synthase [Xanthobacter dioxanivorans]QRG05016.1 RluA family pseudouridine synthase [Xanthobacter dioxanivorans]
MAVAMKTVAEDEAGMRLDRWFKAHFPDLSFGHLQKLVRTGQVRVDGGRVKTSSRLEPGQSVRIPPLGDEPLDEAPAAGSPRAKGGESVAGGSVAGASTEAEAPAKPRSSASAAARQEKDDRAFLKSITLFEDKDVMVLNKPFGLAVQGGSGTYRHIDGLLEVLRDKDGQKPRLVHRIDKDTSGCLLIAKTRLAASVLAKSFRSREARKIYWAVVPGVPKPRQGRISTYLARDEDEEKMRVARHGEDEASHAITYYAVVDQAAQKMSWLSLKPVTGRTHQLRAHLAHIGHPILGDPKYFNIENWELPRGLQNRLHLLARRLVIPHPRGQGVIDVSAPLPPHMAQSFAVLGFDAAQYDPILEAPEG